MKKAKVYVIEDNEYLVTRTVKLNQKKYQELVSNDILNPDTIYVEKANGKFEVVKNWDTYYTLCKKYAVDENSIDGDFFLSYFTDSIDDETILDLHRFISLERFKEELALITALQNCSYRTEDSFVEGVSTRHHFVDSGENKDKLLYTECKINGVDVGYISDFFLDKANEELAKLFESDVVEFSQLGAKAFGRILNKHGIFNPQKWLEEKMRAMFQNKYNSAYSYEYDIFSKARSFPWGEIKYSSLSLANDTFTRAHEMSHKIVNTFVFKKFGDKTFPIGRSGLILYDVKPYIDKKTDEVHYIGKERGRAFNEGVTNLIAEKLTKESSNNQIKETNLARKIVNRVGEDVVFESVFFNPRILETKWNSLMRSKYAYNIMVAAMDIHHNITNIRNQQRLFSFISSIKKSIKTMLKSFSGKHIQLPQADISYKENIEFKENIALLNSSKRESITALMKHADLTPIHDKAREDINKQNIIKNTRLKLLFSLLDSFLFP